MDKRVRGTAVLGTVIGIVLGSCVGAMAQESSMVLLARHIGEAGRLRLQLHAGDYEVRASADDELRVSEVRSAGWSGGPTKTHMKASAGRLTVEVEPPSHVNNSHVHLVIEVPECDALLVGLSAGELQIKAMPCRVSSVKVTAGQIVASLGDGADFREVKGSVTIGEVNATKFMAGEDHGGFFPSYQWRGPGARRFAAHVGTGEIELVR